jgi:hypothetical protein
MGRDPVRASPHGQSCGAYRVRMEATASVADGGNVVDIDAQSKTRRHTMPFLGYGDGFAITERASFGTP